MVASALEYFLFLKKWVCLKRNGFFSIFFVKVEGPETSLLDLLVTHFDEEHSHFKEFLVLFESNYGLFNAPRIIYVILFGPVRLFGAISAEVLEVVSFL